MKSLFSLLLVFICSNASAQFQLKDMQGLYGLNGTWESPRKNGLLIEQWTFKNDSTLQGYSFIIKNSDSIPQEKALLQYRNGNIQFIASAAAQNNEQPVAFSLIAINNGQYLFENKQHDFPQQISYQLLSSDSMQAFISGPMEGVQQKVDFHFSKQKSRFNESLAQSLDADAYGMKQYVLVLLVTGKAKIEAPDRLNKLMAGHMSNMVKLAQEGRLLMAGPFGKNEINGRGLFIINTSSVEQARKIVHSDPAVQAGVLEAIYIPWYGSAALPLLSPLHGQIQKSSF